MSPFLQCAPTTTTPTTTTPTTTTPTTTTPTTTTPTTTTTVSELPPPKFAGCSQIIVYSDTSVSTFEVVLYDEGDDEYSTVTVNVNDADETYQPNHQNFGSGEEGVVGYGFEQGDEFESGLKVVGVIDYQGSDYENPNFNRDKGNCGGAGGVVDGEPFDWSNVLTNSGGVLPVANIDAGSTTPGAALVGLVGSLGLLVRTRE
jgi:hypothetical protein